MKYLIIFLLVISSTLAFTYNPANNFQTFSLKKADTLNLNQERLEVIRITPQNLVLRNLENNILLFNIGEEKTFDINNDNFADISIELNTISNSIAEIAITPLKDAISSSDIEEIKQQFKEPEIIEEPSSNLPIYLALSLISLIFLIVLYNIYKGKKQYY